MAGRLAQDGASPRGEPVIPRAAPASAAPEGASPPPPGAQAESNGPKGSAPNGSTPDRTPSPSKSRPDPELGYEDLMVAASSPSSSPGAPAWLGKRIARFRVLSLLGQGAMGRVFRAEDTLLQRHVALKVLRARTVAGSGRRVAVGQLIREARAAASLEHPHIVQVYDVNEAGGVFYIAMELLEGGSLKDLVSGSGPLAPVTACQLAAEAAEALAHAHQRGVIHRDVKPANLMLTRSGRCKVADFGLARVDDPADLTTLTGEGVGTPWFVAPEILRGAPASARSDVYSLGASLWYLLTVRPPFPGETAGQVVRHVLHTPPPDLRTVRPELSGRLAATVTRALAKDPSRRYESAEQVAKVLRVHTVPSVDDFAMFPGVSAAAGPGTGSSGGLSELADLVAGGSSGGPFVSASAGTASHAGSPPVPLSYSGPRRKSPAARTLKALAAIVPLVLAVAAVGGAVWWARGRMRESPPTAVVQRQAPAAAAPGIPHAEPAPEARRASAQQPGTFPSPAPRLRPVARDLLAEIGDPKQKKPKDFWHVQKWGKGSDVLRRGGKLVLHCAGEPQPGAFIVRKRDGEFDFFAAPVTVSGTGLVFRGAGTARGSRPLRVAFCSEAKSGWTARDAVSLWLGADGLVRFGYKLDKEKADAEGVNKLVDKPLPGDITAFTLTLNAQGYDLTVVYREPGGRELDFRKAGRFTERGPGLKREAWGAEPGKTTGGNGHSAMALGAQQLGAPAGQTATIEIRALTAWRDEPKSAGQ